MAAAVEVEPPSDSRLWVFRPFRFLEDPHVFVRPQEAAQKAPEAARRVHVDRLSEKGRKVPEFLQGLIAASEESHKEGMGQFVNEEGALVMSLEAASSQHQGPTDRLDCTHIG